MGKRKVVERLVKDAALRVVRLDQLQTDPSYQREVKKSHNKIVANFDPDALGVPLVGEREDGTLWIVDGLQRKTALVKLGKKEVRAQVFRSKGAEHEAKVFRKVNLDRTKMSQMDVFRSLLTGHDPIAWKVKETVEKSGLKLVLNTHSKGSDSKNFLALMTAYDVVRRHGTEPLKFACECAVQAWPGDDKATNTKTMEALCMFHVSRKGMIDYEGFFTRLKTVTPHKIQYTASQYVGSLVPSMVQVLEKISRKRIKK